MPALCRLVEVEAAGGFAAVDFSTSLSLRL
jgi:hypothetical protein